MISFWLYRDKIPETVHKIRESTWLQWLSNNQWRDVSIKMKCD